MDNRKNEIKVLYLSYDGLTDPLGQSQVLPYIVGLSQQGYSFTIISFEKHDRFRNGGDTVSNVCNLYDIEWVPFVYHKWPPVLSTLYDLFKLRINANLLHKRNKYRIVHCRSYLTSLVGLWLKEKYGVKFIFDMRGFWADERVDGNIWKLDRPLYKLIYNFFKRKEAEFLTKADHIISLTYRAGEYMATNMNCQTKLTVIPTCVDLHLFDPSKITSIQKAERRRKLGLSERDFIVLYLGSWGTWYMTDRMLELFSEIKKRIPDAKLLIASADHVDVGQFPYRQDVVITQVSRIEVPLIISLASCSLFFIKPAFSKMASSATKLGELIAMQVPVITNSGVGDVDKLLSGNPGSYLIKDFTTSEYSEAVDFVSGLPCQEKFGSLRDYFSLSRGIELYFQVYRHLETSKVKV